MGYEIKDIPLFRIDRQDHTFRMTTENSADDLCASIQVAGIINFPSFIEKQAGTYVIVCGFRRVDAARQLGWGTVQARILDADTSEIECVHMAIIDNALQRTLNLIEISRALSLLDIHLNDPNEVAKSAAALGLPHHPEIIQKLKNLHALPRAIRRGILSSCIALPIALDMASMPENEATALAKLFQHLQLSLNKQREIFTLFREIAFREDISIADVLQDDTIRTITDQKELTRPQKVQHIRDALKNRRFPNISHAENEFQRRLKKLRFGRGISLTAPRHFEGTEYTLTIKFTDLQALMGRTKTLNAALQNPEIENIFYRL